MPLTLSGRALNSPRAGRGPSIRPRDLKSQGSTQENVYTRLNEVNNRRERDRVEDQPLVRPVGLKRKTDILPKEEPRQLNTRLTSGKQNHPAIKAKAQA
jgi:hypothetical protein